LSKSIKISLQFRKKIVAFLLLNFVLFNFSYVFAKLQCDNICGLDTEVLCCSEIQQEITCCEMMDINKSYSFDSYGMNIKQNTCGYEIIAPVNHSFIIPKIVDAQNSLTVQSTAIRDEQKETYYSKIIVRSISLDIGPPIYLTVSSFLI
jgi:hypothetical protein